MLRSLTLRAATDADLDAIRRIYNEGIEDRVATLETKPKSADEMRAWWTDHDARYAVSVAEVEGTIVGWASLNRFSHRCAHADIADLSVYVARSHRGQGVGKRLLRNLAHGADFHKIVLHALHRNVVGRKLYESLGFREVGVFREHGRIDGELVDVIAMEKLR